MAHTRRTLLLTKNWDVTLDGVGRIALTGDDYATAQNVANESRLFTEDAYFIQDQGIPHFTIELGRRANNAVLRSYLRRAALQVPDVKQVLSVEIYSPGVADASGSEPSSEQGGSGGSADRTSSRRSEREKAPTTRTLTGDIQFTTFGRASIATMSARVNLADAPSSLQRSARLASADGHKEGK